MNPNVPAGAAVLLGYISGLETAREGDMAYQTVIAHLNEKGELPKPITAMTLDELMVEQLRWVKQLGQASGAAGAYQIIRPTLQSLIKQFSLPTTAMFTPNGQDSLGYALLKRRGFDRFMAGSIGITEFGNELAKEWASLPLLSSVRRKIKGATRTLQRGQSYYDGVAGNKSLDGAATFEAVLAQALEARTVHTGGDTGAAQPVSDFPTKGTMDNEIVAQVQRRLKELGYTEIGNVDGDFGDFTEKAIIIFRHDAGLPLRGSIDEALLVALAKASPRQVSPARQEATPAEVREAVPEAKSNWWTKIIGLWTAAGSAVLAFFNWLFGSITEVRATVKPVADLFGAIPVWVYALLFVAGGVWLYINGRKGEQASVAAVQEGARR